MTEQQTEAAFAEANKIVLTPVETRSRHKMIRVDRAGRALGLLTKLPSTGGDICPWQAYLGIGHGQKYLGAHYGRDGKQQCINDIVRAAAGVFVGTAICDIPVFEK